MSLHGQAVLDAIRALVSCGDDLAAIRAALEAMPIERQIFVTINIIQTCKITRFAAGTIINEIGWPAFENDIGEQSALDLAALVECLA